jgi:hypothetical protein
MSIGFDKGGGSEKLEALKMLQTMPARPYHKGRTLESKDVKVMGKRTLNIEQRKNG